MHIESATNLAPLTWARTADMGNLDPAHAGKMSWQPAEKMHNIPARIPGYRVRIDIRRWLTQALHFSIVKAPHRINLLLAGPPGSGKTTQAEQFFAALGVPLDRKNASPTDMANDLFYTQSYNAEQGHHLTPGPMFNAFTRGYPFIMNEAFAMAPSELLALNDVIERGLFMLPNGDEIEAAPGFMLIFTDNTLGTGDMTGSCAGTQTQNASVLDRLVTLWVGYMEPAEELEAALLPFQDDPAARASAEPVAHRIIQLANAIRNSSVMGGNFSTRQVCSLTYETAAFAILNTYGEDPYAFVLQARLLNKLSDEERLAVVKMDGGK